MDFDQPDRPITGYRPRVAVAGDAVLDARSRRRAEQAAIRRRRRRVAMRAGCGAVVALGVVLALVLPGEIGTEPTIVDAADFTVAPATAPPPERNRDHPSLLDTTISGPAHPYLQETLGWTATGSRTDFLGDRQVITAFYEREGRRVGYAIVEGSPLPPPVATTDEQLDGLRLRSFQAAGRTVVTWLRGGRTCVLSGRGVDSKTLVTLAAGSGRPQTVED